MIPVYTIKGDIQVNQPEIEKNGLTNKSCCLYEMTTTTTTTTTTQVFSCAYNHSYVVERKVCLHHTISV